MFIRVHSTINTILGDWEGFEGEVVRYFEGVPWHKHQEILGYKLPSGPIGSMGKEHYACGEEISTSGRYVNNGLHPTGGVAKQLQYPTYYGDWKATSEGATVFKYGLNGFEKVTLIKNQTTKKRRGQVDLAGQMDENKSILIPDYALMDSNREPRAIEKPNPPGITTSAVFGLAASSPSQNFHIF